MAQGTVLAAQLGVTLSVMTCAERCPDVCGNQTTEFFARRVTAPSRGVDRITARRFIAVASAQDCEVMDRWAAPDFAQALSFSPRKYRPSNRPSLSFSRRGLPAIRGAVEPFEDV